MPQATWNDPTATWADLNVAWDGTRAPTGGGLMRRGPYRVRIEGTVEVQVDDDELVLILHSLT